MQLTCLTRDGKWSEFSIGKQVLDLQVARRQSQGLFHFLDN